MKPRALRSYEDAVEHYRACSEDELVAALTGESARSVQVPVERPARSGAEQG